MNKPKIATYTIQPAWYYASNLLDSLHIYVELENDDKFQKLLKALEDYITDKLYCGTDNDMLDMILLITQSVREDK